MTVFVNVYISNVTSYFYKLAYYASLVATTDYVHCGAAKQFTRSLTVGLIATS